MTSGGIDWQREKWQSGLGSKFIHQGEKNAVKYADVMEHFPYVLGYRDAGKVLKAKIDECVKANDLQTRSALFMPMCYCYRNGLELSLKKIWYVHPILTDVLYVNEMSLAGKAPYETKQDMDKALTGRTKSNGGILPDDNVRIYVPMDLNADIIMWRLYSLHSTLGYSTEKNESAYCSGVGKVISQLEIYDQVWTARNLEDTVQKEDDGVRHSHQGIELAK